MSLITVKLYGRYYNVSGKDGTKNLTLKQALERAVALGKLGKPFSGPTAAKKALPKKKVDSEIEDKVEEKVETNTPPKEETVVKKTRKRRRRRKS